MFKRLLLVALFFTVATPAFALPDDWRDQFFMETSHSVSCGEVEITLRNVSPWYYPVSVEIDGVHSYGPELDNRIDSNGDGVIDYGGPMQDRWATRTITFPEDSGVHDVRYRIDAGSENELYLGREVNVWTTFQVESDCEPDVEPGQADLVLICLAPPSGSYEVFAGDDPEVMSDPSVFWFRVFHAGGEADVSNVRLVSSNGADVSVGTLSPGDSVLVSHADPGVYGVEWDGGSTGTADASASTTPCNGIVPTVDDQDANAAAGDTDTSADTLPHTGTPEHTSILTGLAVILTFAGVALVLAHPRRKGRHSVLNEVRPRFHPARVFSASSRR